MTRRILIALLLTACHRVESPRAKPNANANANDDNVANAIASNDAVADSDGDAPAPDGRRFHDATVYVDGKAILGFTYNEMPPGVKIYEKNWGDPGETYEHFLICDYLKQLGVDCKDVKETHWYAGRSRIAIISGDELRRYRDKLYFNFTRETFGKPRVEWSKGIHTNDTVDLVSDLVVYVHKKPPRWDRETWSLIDDKGDPIDGIPYAPADDVRGGVRVNVDARLAAKIKRNLLEGNVTPVSEGPDGARYSLASFLAQKNLAPKQPIRAVELITREERVIRLFGDDAKDVSFVAAKKKSGEVMFYFGKHFAPAIAVNVWASLPPPDRKMRTLDFRGVAAAGGENTSQVNTTQVRGRR